MSIRAHEQQVLKFIEDGIAGADPKLTSMLATFTRLTAGEELPSRERIRSDWRRQVTRQPDIMRRYPPRPGMPHRARPSRESRRWQLVWPLLWLAVSTALVAFALAVSHGGQGACAVGVSACAGQTSANTIRPGSATAAGGAG